MSKLTRMTAAQVIVEYLIHEKVPYVLGIFGHGNVQLGEALKEREKEITFIQMKNEQTAVFMAIAYAKMTGKPLAVTASIGPGATNLVTGTACAHVNRLPVLLLPGDAFADSAGPVLQQIEGNVDGSLANECIKPVSVFWRRIMKAEQLQTILPQAFDRMLEPGEEGPVVLCLPMDVQAEAHDFDLEMLLKPRDKEWQRVAPDPRAIKRAAELIAQAKRPLIIAGGGVLRSGAWGELIALAEYKIIPVAQTQAGNGALLFDHLLNAFSTGPTGSDCGNILASKADLVIGVGTRYTDFTTSSETLFGPRTQFININISHVDIGKQRAVKLLGDAKATLTLLLDELRSHDPIASHAYLREVEGLRKEWIDWTSTWRALEDIPLAQSAVIGIVNDFCGEKDVVVCAAGSLPGDLFALWCTKDPTRKGYHVEYGYSAMGYEIAGGIGAALADSERRVYVMVGDGSFLMASQEIVTAVQEGIALTIVLLDNHGHRSIEGCQRGNGFQPFATEYRMRDRKTETLTGDYLPIDFMKIAEGYGARAIKAETKGKVIAALREAKKETTKPTVVYIPVDPQKRFERQFHAWWNVPVPETSEQAEVLKRYRINKAQRTVR